MIRRRRILLGGLAFAAVAGFGLWGADVFTESEIASSVRRRLGFLKLDDAGLHSFAKDQVAWVLSKRPTWYRVKFHVRALFSKSGPNWGFRRQAFAPGTHGGQPGDDVSAFERFLSNGADESRTVRYVALYDPMRPCVNPFALSCD